SDIAWKDAKYAQIWEYLRDEFELTQRFASLDFKLKFVEHNIRFLQEILQNRKSDFLEWFIIILILLQNAQFIFPHMASSSAIVVTCSGIQFAAVDGETHSSEGDSPFWSSSHMLSKDIASCKGSFSFVFSSLKKPT
nr:sporulation protein RMD1-like [Tanacetum cinerariifolium]